MVITFVERRRKLRYLLPVLVITVLITAFVLWRGFFAKEKLPPILPSVEVEIPAKKIELNFQILKNPFLEELQLPEAIPPFEGEPGRENPFLPYEITK